MGKSGKGPFKFLGKNGLTYLLLAAGGILAFEFITNKGGQFDFISKGLNMAGIKSNYVRGNQLWGDEDTDY